MKSVGKGSLSPSLQRVLKSQKPDRIKKVVDHKIKEAATEVDPRALPFLALA